MPVIVGAGKAVQRRGDEIVELIERACLAQGAFVEQSGKALELGEGRRFECVQEIPRIDGVEAARKMVAAGGEVEGRADGSGSFDDRCGGGLLLAEPLEQRVAAQRDADGVNRPCRLADLDAAENPVDLVAVAGMIGARQAVRLA